MKHLEYDPRRDICWSVVTDAKLANSLSLKPFTVKLYMWNETKVNSNLLLLRHDNKSNILRVVFFCFQIYNDTFSSKNIVKWVIENSHFLTRWLFFKNSKNTLLSDLLEHNQAVILFTPRNMYSNLNPWYLMVRFGAMNYFNKKFSYNSGNLFFLIVQRSGIRIKTLFG